ncbi:HD domain-containing protein [Paenibacillus turpanensis]|uniref:HD domain-containing protein n=1 Tax=Paenibacillus turpanensis TaxID=2689078 RepID=UPI00140DD742|nr:HD domain-containing protein [Paenibacillus turpanensis]
MQNENILLLAEEKVREALGHDKSGHDWNHIRRVANAAWRLAKLEGADPFVCRLAALFHDMIDDKLVDNVEKATDELFHWMKGNGVDVSVRGHVIEIISTMSYRGGVNRPAMKTLEGKVVQDADRLDALGAIGIARTFTYSGHKGRAMHDPEKAPRVNMTIEQYRSGEDTAINHFYEKLLKLKDGMNTDTGKRWAEERHQFMLQFLDQFLLEWEQMDLT